MRKQSKSIIAMVIAAVVVIVALLWAGPTYKVWQQEMSGKAVLAEATFSRQVQIEQARAELESANIRAEAIAVIGQAAKDFPEYRQQQYLAAMGEALMSDKIEQMIYVPTEGTLPLTEATRLLK